MTFTFPTSGKLLAPAKINLHLKVTALLPDGRHQLDTSFAFIDTYDVLHIKLTEHDISVECSIKALSNEKNLVFQIVKALKEQHHVQQGMHISIEKNIPSEAGLGGGSSDAASALLAANEIWGLHLSTQQLIDFSTPFGADIPCFLFGQASLAKGVGEQLEVYPDAMPNHYICLAKPPQGLSTKKVFQYFDLHKNIYNHMILKDINNTTTSKNQLTTLPNIETSLTQKKSADTMRAASQGNIPVGENELQGSAIALLPEISSLLDTMQQHADMAWMSGSGSSCIALCSSLDQAKKLAKLLQEKRLASWVHAGSLLHRHPSFAKNIGA